MTRTGKSALFLLSGLLLVVGLLGFQRQAGVSALPIDLVLPAESFPAELAEHSVPALADLQFQVEAHSPGDRLELVPESGGQATAFTLAPAYDSSYLAVTAISGFFFWAMAVVVLLPRFDLRAVPQFFWITMLYGLGILVGGVYFQAPDDKLGLFLSLIQVSSLAFLPVLFLHLSMVFPVPQALGRWRPGWPWPLYGLALVLVLWQASAFLEYFRQPGLAAGRRLGQVQSLADGIMVVEASLGILFLVRQERRLGQCRERQQVRWLLLGFVLGASPYLFLRTLPQLFHLTPPFPAYMDRIFEPAIPLAFVLTIVRHRFLDIDIILRRGALYGLLTAILAVMVLVPAMTIGAIWPGVWPWLSTVLPVVGGVIAGLLFRPLKNNLGRRIDQLFFKIEFRTHTYLSLLEKELAKAPDLTSLMEIVHQYLETVLSPERCQVVLDQKQRPPEHPGRDLVGVLSPGNGLILQAAPQATTRPEYELKPFPPQLTVEGMVLAVPMLADGQPVGGIFLGVKKSAHRYVRSDLDFLSRMAKLVSTRLREIHLIQDVVEEQLARQQLDDLGRVKDEFLSKVAHDLRTPVTSLGWSMRNMLDGLAGELTPHQQVYLNTMDQAVTHLDGLVAGLLEISRLEKAQVELDVQMLELGPILERALGTVRPLAESREINLDLVICEEVSFALADKDKLAEVLVNLLSNAIRFSPDGQTVETRVLNGATGISILVRDHGPGFSGIEDPFARFVQGDPSPHSEGGGYGLGLTIAHEYTELMEGVISGRNHPAGGAEFRVDLKCETEEEGEQNHGT